jgi:hypothetical protein
MPSHHPLWRTSWLAACVLIGATGACRGAASVPLIPLVARATLIAPSPATPPRAAAVLPPIRESAGIVTTVAARVPGTVTDGLVIRGPTGPHLLGPVAFIVDDRLWCPRLGPGGRFTDASAPPLDGATIVSVDVVRDPVTVASQARRCAARVRGIIRVRTSAGGRR